jgi:uncharacterized protein
MRAPPTTRREQITEPGPEKPDVSTSVSRVDGTDATRQGTTVPLGTFFIVTFATTWALWGLAAAVPVAAAWGSGARPLLFLPGTFAPALVALWLTNRSGGSGATRALIDRLFVWNVRMRWYAFAGGYLIAVKLTAALVHRGLIGTWPEFGTTPVVLLLMAAILSTPFQAGEEIGWRGVALPRLATRLGLGQAAVVLGVIWALWHLPLFFIADTPTTGQSFPVYLLSVTALSVAIAWLYAHTGGSLLLVMLMHAAINNTKGIVSSGQVNSGNPFDLSSTPMGWITMAVLWAFAAVLLLRMPGRRHAERSAGEVGSSQS